MRKAFTELIQTIRTTVCTTCFRRPPGSERWAANHARPCEGECTVFATTPLLLRLAEMGGSNARASMAKAISKAACMGDATCGPSVDRHVNCLSALQLTDAKIDQILDTISKPAQGAD